MAETLVDDKHQTKQVVIIHLSDLHFGPKHRFDPGKTPAGDIPTRKGFPTLLQKLAEDLKQPDPGCPIIVCLTGDFAETGELKQFQHAAEFVTDLTKIPIFSQKIGLTSIFVVAGNHDVAYTESSPALRLASFGWFLNTVYGAGTASSDPSKWKLLFDDFENSGVILLCLNSSMYVEKDKPDQERGHIDADQLLRIEKELKRFKKDKLHQAIKIALIHHHPVLIPPLAEPGRGYDAVHNSGQLLSILRRYGFHMILHGHKHDPYVFTEDSRSAFRLSFQNPILVAAGGSIASKELPKTRWNCYNRISLKWHPAAAQARILIETVGLSVIDEDGEEELPGKWKWQVLRREDIHFLKGECIPYKSPKLTSVPLSKEQWKQADYRHAEYDRLRNNMLCVEVRPSLLPKQGYEAVVWITEHRKVPEENRPVGVEWSAGEKFNVITEVSRDKDPRFCATFDYWGPMLIQARLIFQNGVAEHAFIYARIPEDCSTDSKRKRK